MKIAIDARFWGPGHTGLGVYTKELVTFLAKVDSINQYFLLVRPDFDKNSITSPNFSFVVVNAIPYTFKEQIVLSLTLLKINPDVTHFPSINAPIFYFKKMVVTIHDLIKHQSRGVSTSTLPVPVYWLKYFVYRLLVWWLALRANKIIVPSNAVAHDLEAKHPFSKTKIAVTYEAPTLGPQVKKAPLSLPDKFAIYTGNAYPHKNLPFLISSWKKVYEETKTKLVLVCGRSVFAKRIETMVEEISANGWVDFKGYVTDEQLAFAYSKATLYVFPTLMEGFGIPGLDAMNSSLPVLCSNIPVLKEIYGNAALYFDPRNQSDFENKAIGLLESATARKKLIEAGKRTVKQFSWEKMAKQTLTAYQEVVS